MVKFIPKLIVPINRPIIIVGEKPNTTRDNSTFALVGNRTGDFVAEAIEGKENIILTNIVNYLYKGKFDSSLLGEGILDLMSLIELYSPKKIICLGGISYTYTKGISSIPKDCQVVPMPHPSWVNRFKNRSRSDYIKMLKDELESNPYGQKV